MICAPGFGAIGRTGIAFRQVVERLENHFGGDVAFVFAQHFAAEILFEILADHEYDFAETALDGIVD